MNFECTHCAPWRCETKSTVSHPQIRCELPFLTPAGVLLPATLGFVLFHSMCRLQEPAGLGYLSFFTSAVELLPDLAALVFVLP